jgi:hypothetical protein
MERELTPRGRYHGESGTTDFDALWNHGFRLGKAKAENPRLFTPRISAFNILNNPNFTD